MTLEKAVRVVRSPDPAIYPDSVVREACELVAAGCRGVEWAMARELQKVLA